MAPFIFVYRFRKAENPHPEKVSSAGQGHHIRRLLVPTTGWLVVTQHGQEVHQEGRPWRQPPQCRPQAAALGKPQGGRAAAAAAKVKRVAEAAAAAAKASELSSLLRFFKLQPPSSEQPPTSK